MLGQVDDKSDLIWWFSGRQECGPEGAFHNYAKLSIKSTKQLFLYSVEHLIAEPEAKAKG